MPGTGLFLLSAVALAGPIAMPGPRLTRGDELVYRGEVVAAGERVDNRFRKLSDIEIRLFVMDVRGGFTDMAVLTSIRRRSDPHVIQAVATVAGTDAKPTVGLAAVTLELVRVDNRGRAKFIVPDASRPPLLLDTSTPTANTELIPLDGPPSVELGMFVPLPAGQMQVGGRWNAPGGEGRPPITLTVAGETVWNGGRCVELAAVQRTVGWDRPADIPTGWQRTETIRLSPDDGISRTVRRRIEQRHGGHVDRWAEIEYELEPPRRHVGLRYTDVRRDVEAAYSFAAELARISALAGDTMSRDFVSLRARIDSTLADTPAATGFRPAIESVRRQCDAACRGELVPTVAVARTEPVRKPKLGQPVADFLAPTIAGDNAIRLASTRGKPTVLVFYTPGDDLTAMTLTVAEALHQRYSGRVAVLPLAVTGDTEAADREREHRRLTVPVYDGTGVRRTLRGRLVPAILRGRPGR